MVQRRTYLKILASGATAGIAGCNRVTGEPTRGHTGRSTRRHTEQSTRGHTPRDTDRPTARTTKLVGEGTGPLALFGDAVTVDGDTALVGAPDAQREADLETDLVYVFERTTDGWRREATLVPQDGDQDGSFGDSVALDGETALIGRPDGTERTGTLGGEAFVFERSGGRWRQQAILSFSNGEPGDEFGRAVALDGDTALVGAPLEFLSSGSRPGAAYVFERSGGDWSHETTLVPDKSYEASHFGDAVELEAGTALVGAPYAGDLVPGQGRAYVFGRSDGEWAQHAILTDDASEQSARIGTSVALDGDRALVGASGASDSSGIDAGSVYLFERTGDGTDWARTTRFAPDAVDAHDWFGVSVALDGEIALVGAKSDEDPDGPLSGAAYVFERTDGDWSLRGTLASGDGVLVDRFGASVALDGTVAVVGAPRAKNASVDSGGAAFVFDLASGAVRWPDETEAGHRARDPDDDGRYEDVTDDGEPTPGDATVLFEDTF